MPEIPAVLTYGSGSRFCDVCEEAHSDFCHKFGGEHLCYGCAISRLKEGFDEMFCTLGDIAYEAQPAPIAADIARRAA